jgi:hypothetical protein
MEVPMKKTIVATIALAGVAGTIAGPAIVSGNARRTLGSLEAQQVAETPYVAMLLGSNETPAPGDPDGSGAAAVSIVLDGGTMADTAEVCFDLAYSGIADPTMAHIHDGPTGSAGPVVVDFGAPTPDSFSGCVDNVDNTVAADILMNPAEYYVNVHNADHPGGALRGQLSAGPAPAGSTHLLPTPLRAYDSRIAPATQMADRETRTVSLATGVDLAGNELLAVPPGATAAIVTLTATETAGPGWLAIYSNAVSQPATSNLNFSEAQVSIAVSTQVAVDAGGNIKITAGPAATHVVVDVIGYLY